MRGVTVARRARSSAPSRNKEGRRCDGSLAAWQAQPNRHEAEQRRVRRSVVLRVLCTHAHGTGSVTGIRGCHGGGVKAITHSYATRQGAYYSKHAPGYHPPSAPPEAKQGLRRGENQGSIFEEVRLHGLVLVECSIALLPHPSRIPFPPPPASQRRASSS